MIRAFRNLMSRLDPMSQTIIAINIVMYLYNIFKNGMSAFTGLSGTEMLDVGGMTAHTPFYTLITSMFAHGSFMHILMNMITLGVLGNIAYRQFGIGMYLMSYFGGSIIGNILSEVVTPNVATVGASGGIYGLLGMLSVGVIFRSELGMLRSAILGLLGINLIYTFIDSRIDVTSHLTGLSVGSIISAIMMYKFMKNN